MKINQEISSYVNRVMLLLETDDYHYISLRADDPVKTHRNLYKRLYRYFSGEVPVKIVKDGNMIWVTKR